MPFYVGMLEKTVTEGGRLKGVRHLEKVYGQKSSVWTTLLAQHGDLLKVRTQFSTFLTHQWWCATD